ncbi:MAG: cobalamin biosynthesis protein [Burkholderiaceae bacterium]|jgi:cobalt-precorrin 5A hydrolase|nr:cobalamin biosynthesis protein [Burkholderiaceae bacterium]
MSQDTDTAPSGHRCGVLGLGMHTDARPDALQALWQQALDRLEQEHGAPQAVCAVAVMDTKAGHPALAPWLAQALSSPVLVRVPPEQLPGQPVVTQSPRMLARYGTGSVAEAAALAAAGPGAALRLARMVAGDGSATLALALRQAGPLNCCLAHAGEAANQGATA